MAFMPFRRLWANPHRQTGPGGFDPRAQETIGSKLLDRVPGGNHGTWRH